MGDMPRAIVLPRCCGSIASKRDPLAALASVPDSIGSGLYYRANVLGTKSMLDAMKTAVCAKSFSAALRDL